MKRCPQCEFIYEDDQSLCDMDGILLVFDSQKLPKPKYEKKRKWRSRLVSGLVAGVLSLVLWMVFYVTLQPQPPSGTSFRPAAVNRQPTAEVKAEPPAPKVEEKKTEKAPVTKSESTAKPKSEVVPKASPKPAQPKTTSQKPTTTVTTQASAKKNESKLGSLMKKTGKILKKPFRL